MSTAITTESADFYALESLLDDDEQQFLHRVRDAEAIYSYEGTLEMNRLIVGRAITGLSAFV